jgi:signal transduction histidine kinase
MKPADIEKQLKYAIIPLSLLSSCLLMYPMIGFDEVVLALAHVKLGALNFPWWGDFGHLILIVPCVLAMYASQRLASQARMIVFCQLLFVLLGLGAFAVAKLHVFVGLISITGALIIGLVSGLFLQNVALLAQSREKNEAELVLRNRTAIESQLQLVRQDEVERRLLAGDLHDQVLNDLRLVRQGLKDQNNAKDSSSNDLLEEQLRKAMDDIRRVMDNLCPLEIEHIGLADAVEACLERGSELSGYNLRFRSKVDAQAVDCLSKTEQLLLFRLVQETVNNICKHSDAKNVVAEILKEEANLVVRISDDGKGISPDKFEKDSRGMRYMRQRAGLIGGTVGWKAGEEKRGVTVEIKVPPHVEEIGQSAT